jgi:hypothetical protein
MVRGYPGCAASNETLLLGDALRTYVSQIRLTSQRWPGFALSITRFALLLMLTKLDLT